MGRTLRLHATCGYFVVTEQLSAAPEEDSWDTFGGYTSSVTRLFHVTCVWSRGEGEKFEGYVLCVLNASLRFLMGDWQHSCYIRVWVYDVGHVNATLVTI